MSLYDTIFKRHAKSVAILAMLGLIKSDVGRFRNCFVINNKIAVYTRNGGDNRKDFQGVFDTLSRHTCYIGNEDDTFDSTYATIFFSFPKEFSEELKKIASGEEFIPSERWLEAIEASKQKEGGENSN